MAHWEHLIVIKKGVEAWNEWRWEAARGEVDLSNADLSGASLIEVDFKHVNLRRTNLSGTDLSRADLSGADLSEAKLRGGNLTQARLSGTNLSMVDLTFANLNFANLSGAEVGGADLTGASFRGADLSDADLYQVDLSRADLSGAVLVGANLNLAQIGETTFANNNLSSVKGLEKALHWTASTIGIDTLYRSDGKISEVFLRGAGVPEDFIVFVPSLIGRAIEFYSCFISYNHQDEEFSRRLYSRMRSENLRVWYAPEDMKGGSKLHEEIFSAIQIHDKLLLVLSESSMESEWVITEIRRARKVEREENRRKLFPIRLVGFDAIQKWECFDADSGKDLAVELREYYIPDFSSWKNHDSFEAEFAKLLRDLRATKI